jgi:hypothetical protein
VATGALLPVARGAEDAISDTNRRAVAAAVAEATGVSAAGPRAGVLRRRRTPARRWPGHQGVSRQATVQAAPLRVYEVGLPVLPVWVAWKPMRIDVPAAMPGL